MTDKNKKNSGEEIKKRLNEDPDFIYAPHYKYSLSYFLKIHPEGTSDFNKIAKFLKLSRSEAEKIYHSAIEKIRKFSKIKK